MPYTASLTALLLLVVIGCTENADAPNEAAPQQLVSADVAPVSLPFVTLRECPGIEWQLTPQATDAYAVATGKPVLFCFFSVNDVNGHMMRQRLFTKPNVREALSEFALGALFVDNDSLVFEDSAGHKITTDGESNQRLQKQIGQGFDVEIPLFVICRPLGDGQYDVISTHVGHTPERDFLAFLAEFSADTP